MSEEQKVYSSVDQLVADSKEEYAIIDGFKAGVSIRIRSVTAGDMIEWSEANEGEAKKNAGLRLIIKSLVDDTGRLIATDKDIPKFKEMQHKVTERIVKEILKLNGMTVKQDKDAKND